MLSGTLFLDDEEMTCHSMLMKIDRNGGDFKMKLTSANKDPAADPPAGSGTRGMALLSNIHRSLWSRNTLLDRSA